MFIYKLSFNKIINKNNYIPYLLVSVFILTFYISCTKDNSADVNKLKQLQAEFKKNKSTDKELTSIYNLKNEAFKQDNDDYKAKAYYYLSSYFSKSYLAYIANKDSAVYNLQKSKHYYTLTKNKKGKVATEYRMTDLLLWDGNYQTALNTIIPVLKEAKNSKDYYNIGKANTMLANIYILSGKPDEGLQTLDEASEAFQKYMPSFKEKLPKEYNNILYHQALASLLLNKPEASLSYCNTYISNTEKLNVSKKLKVENYLNIGRIRVMSLLELKRINEAKLAIQEIQSYLKQYPDLEAKHPNSLNFILATYYYKINDYSQASHYIDLISPLEFHHASATYYTQILKLKADIYVSMGDYQAAAYTRNKISEYSDSIQKTNTVQQLNSLKNEFEIEKLTMQAEKNAMKVKYTRFALFLLGTICTLLIIAIYTIIRNSKKLKNKNTQIISQYSYLDEYTKKVNDLSLLVDNKDKTPETDKELSLFEKTESYLRESEDFKDPSLSRESLALKLGTNRQYLTQAIQENVGKTFTEYIYDMRLEYARRLLSYNPDLSIDNVYSMAGFSSKSNFYRLFKQKYDITPKEVKQIMNKNKHQLKFT